MDSWALNSWTTLVISDFSTIDDETKMNFVGIFSFEIKRRNKRFRFVNISINWSSQDVNEADGTVDANSTRYWDASLDEKKTLFDSYLLKWLFTIWDQDHVIEMKTIQLI